MANTILLISILTCMSIGVKPLRLLTMMRQHERRVQQLLNTAEEDDIKRCRDQKTNNVRSYWFEQPLDHFAKDSPKWWNHYHVQDRHYDNRSEVVVLEVGGEGTSSPLFVCLRNVTNMRLAAKHNALVVQSEHRFFGPNKNLKDLSRENLQYLTVDQALQDILALIKHINNEFGLHKPRWIAVGGSYPGTLTAYLRAVFPEATAGGIASSAPLYPKTDFYEYSQVMVYAFNDTDPNCLNNIKAAFGELEEAGLTVAGRQKIKDNFNIDDNFNVKNTKTQDLLTVYAEIFGAFQGIVQYTYDGLHKAREHGGPLTVEHVCEIMGRSLKPMEKLYEVYKLSAIQNDGTLTPVEYDYQKSILNLKNTSIDGPARDARAWMWMSCTQFGWFQSTTGSTTFGNVCPLSYYYQFCKDVYGDDINTNYIERGIRQTLDSYGYADKYNGTNVVLSNSAYDPWSSLGSYVTNPNTHTTSRVTPAAAHCSDLYPPYEGEPAGLTETRKIEDQEVLLYLQAATKSSHRSYIFWGLATLCMSIFTVL